MEFTIKPAKQKKRGKGVQAAKSVCPLPHCPRKADHCTRVECAQRVNDNTQSLENVKLALAISLDGRIAETKRLVVEIQEKCDLEAVEDGDMKSSFSAFTTGFEREATNIVCSCPECKQEEASLELGVVAKRLAVTQDWLAALREYRSNHDLEDVIRASGQTTK
jgi:hypothetical protein